MTVEVVDYGATLHAWNGTYRTTVTPGTSLYFNWTPEAGARSDVPTATYDWRYEPSDGSTPIPNPIPYGFNNQSWVPPKSGTMYVNVKLNGIARTLSRSIHVGPATLTLSAAPAKVYAGDTVHFTAAIKPDSTTVSGLRWFWFPEEPVLGLRAHRTEEPTAVPLAAAALSQTTDSIEIGACAGYRTCDRVVYARGAMRVHAVVAGTAKQAERDVDVRHVKITLAATPNRTIKGKRVYFRATASTGGGSRASVAISQWTWQDAGGVSTPSCPTGYDTCDQLVFRSGSMRAIGTVNGSTDTAFVTVPAFDCDTTGIPELDDLDMRDSLDNFWNRRRAMGPLGKEGTAVIDRDSVGEFFFEELPPLSSTACYFTLASPFPSRLANGILFHSHNETVPPATTIPLECRRDCVPGFLGDPPSCSMGPLDMKSPSTYPDPSPADWEYHDYRKDFPERAGTISIDGATISKRTSDPSQWNDQNPSRKRFDRRSWKSCTATPI